MSSNPYVILSAFADEGAVTRTAVEQMATLAALGLEYYSLRWVNVSGTVKNVMGLNKTEISKLNRLHADFGLHVTSIGSPIGKVKLLDVDDGSHDRFVPFRKYLNTEVAVAIERAQQFDTKLIRGFSFYYPRGTDPWDHVQQTVDQLSQIVEKCSRAGIIFGLEVEANLVGQNGRLLAELSKQVNSPHMMCIFDGGNLATQNKRADECFDEYQAMRKYIGWMHIKDYSIDPRLTWTGTVDEDRLKNFVPANAGDVGHEAILRDFRAHIGKLSRKMIKLGAAGVFLELEPHLKGGGQFGGFSGPDGLGVACRALCSLLDYVGIDYQLRNFDHIRTARGF